jgi:uncharacterized protein
MHIKRQLIESIKKFKKSILLIGPRQTGKSTLISSLKPDLEINLADGSTYLDFLKDPDLLRKRVAKNKTIFIDEIQKIPSLLNTVQTLIDKDKNLQFFLTGSSARKLRRGQANLLPGRILTYEIGPLTLTEINKKYDLEKLLSTGALPGIFTEENSDLNEKLLKSYAQTYLREEVQAEALTRNLEGFSRFFDIIASRSGDFIDFSKFSSLASIERTSAKRYFDILVDTLILTEVPSFTKSSKRRLVQHPRFYFFDVGVLNGSLGNFIISNDRIGVLFEHLCLQMIVSEAKARDQEIRVSVYRTEAGAEVDFIVERNNQTYAIEIKASKKIRSQDLKGLKSFTDFYGPEVKKIVITINENILVLPLNEAIKEIFD